MLSDIYINFSISRKKLIIKFVLLKNIYVDIIIIHSYLRNFKKLWQFNKKVHFVYPQAFQKFL